MLTAIKMVLVFALLGGTLWFLRRHDRSSLLSARRAERPVTLLAQTKVGKTSSVALVRIGGESYAVGVTEQSVTLLVEHPIELPEPDEATDDLSEPAVSSSAPAKPAVPATLGAAVRHVLGRRSRVQYLDVALPVQAGPTPGTDGSGSSHAARMPEHLSRR